MRVDAYNQINQIYNKTEAHAKSQISAPSKVRDRIEISDLGKTMNIAKDAVRANSDIREDKIAVIKDKIQKGLYDVSADELAEKLLENYRGVF